MIGAEVARQVLPGIPISLSSDVVPELQEYERTVTTVADAYVKPRVGSYVKNLQRDPKVSLLVEDGIARAAARPAVD